MPPCSATDCSRTIRSTCPTASTAFPRVPTEDGVGAPDAIGATLNGPGPEDPTPDGRARTGDYTLVIGYRAPRVRPLFAIGHPADCALPWDSRSRSCCTAFLTCASATTWNPSSRTTRSSPTRRPSTACRRRHRLRPNDRATRPRSLSATRDTATDDHVGTHTSDRRRDLDQHRAGSIWLPSRRSAVLGW